MYKKATKFHARLRSGYNGRAGYKLRERFKYVQRKSFTYFRGYNGVLKELEALNILAYKRVKPVPTTKEEAVVPIGSLCKDHIIIEYK